MDSISKTLNLENTMDKLIAYFKTPAFWISLIILASAIVLWKVIKRAKKSWKEKNGGLTTTSNVVFDVIRVIFVFVVVIVLLQLNGVNVTGLITGLGIVSAIVGLALQDFLKDIIMGVHILIDKFFQVGDVVRYQDEEGVVISFNVRTTKLKLLRYNETVTISNRNISEIAVLSDMFDLDIGLTYGEDPEKIHRMMREIEKKALKIKGIKNCQYKGTERFEESSVIYRLRYWTEPDFRRFDVRRALVSLVQTELRAADIAFAFRHMDVDIIQREN